MREYVLVQGKVKGKAKSYYRSPRKKQTPLIQTYIISFLNQVLLDNNTDTYMHALEFTAFHSDKKGWNCNDGVVQIEEQTEAIEEILWSKVRPFLIIGKH
ncbi:unnamed protein product [Dovyalis caffra]|uniref:Uncharacterized protein n=1 Tax=Dovyalis caffra TaxID=77055 RepID=A0AAV1S7X3_9ROSI|nr:unnamed protein product [Dovyalis caffra]